MTRDDLFTNIHKAIRYGLFDLITTTGATDWNHTASAAVFEAKWRRLDALLQAHTAHEDRHILRILDPHDPDLTLPVETQHRELDALLDEIRTWIERVVADPEPMLGLAVYRELALFTADYLRHIHDEETVIMSRIWEQCTDDEIAATRAAFMAEMTPDVLDTSLRFMLPAIGAGARTGLISGLAATAPPEVVDGVIAIAQQVLDPVESDRLGLVASRPAGL